MIVKLGLDLSFHSSGIAIFDAQRNELKLATLTPLEYDFEAQQSKVLSSVSNGLKIAQKIAKMLQPYRNYELHICYEYIVYGFRSRKTSSDSDLHAMQSIVIAHLMNEFNCKVLPVTPKTHKKSLTGNGSGDKQASINELLKDFDVPNVFEKLDDVADAYGLLTCIENREILKQAEISRLV